MPLTEDLPPSLLTIRLSGAECERRGENRTDWAVRNLVFTSELLRNQPLIVGWSIVLTEGHQNSVAGGESSKLIIELKDVQVEKA